MWKSSIVRKKYAKDLERQADDKKVDAGLPDQTHQEITGTPETWVARGDNKKGSDLFKCIDEGGFSTRFAEDPDFELQSCVQC